MLNNLTSLEQKALIALRADSKGNGHDFGVMEYVEWNGSRKQLGALVTTLQAKGIITDVSKTIVDNKTITQYVLAEAARHDKKDVKAPMNLKELTAYIRKQMRRTGQQKGWKVCYVGNILTLTCTEFDVPFVAVMEAKEMVENELETRKQGLKAHVSTNDHYAAVINWVN